MPAPSRGQPRADPRPGPGHGEERGPRALSFRPPAVCESRKAAVRASPVRGGLPGWLRALDHRLSGVMHRRPRLRPPCRVRGTPRWRSRAGRGMRYLVGNGPGSKGVLPALHSMSGPSLQPFKRPAAATRHGPQVYRRKARAGTIGFSRRRAAACERPVLPSRLPPEGMVERTGLTACPVGSKRP